MRFYLSLGSNLGDRAANLEAACTALSERDARIVRRSRVYETDPVGGPPGQPDFFNQIVEVDVPFGARQLFERTAAVETALGRDRSREERNGPRTIDIDVVLGDEQVADGDLVVPHPRMAERAFVLVPLAEIAPEAVIPGHGAVRDVLGSLGESATRGVRIVAN